MNKEERDLNFSKLFQMYVKKMWVIVSVAVIFAIALGGFSLTANKETSYKIENRIMIVNSKITDTQGVYEAQNSIQRNIFLSFLKSEILFEQMKEHLSFDVETKDLKGFITPTLNDEDGSITVSVTHNNKEKAEEITKVLLDISRQYVSTNLEVTPFSFLLIDQRLIEVKGSNKFAKSAIVGGAAGAFVSVVALFILFITNKKLEDKDDVEYYLDTDCLETITKGDKKSVGFTVSQMLIKYSDAKVINLCGFYGNAKEVAKTIGEAISEKGKNVLFATKGSGNKLDKVNDSFSVLEFSNAVEIKENINEYKNAYDMIIFDLTAAGANGEQLDIMPLGDISLLLVAKSKEKYPQLTEIKAQFENCGFKFDCAVLYSDK